VYYVSFYIFYLATGKFYGCALYEFGAKFTSAIRFQGRSVEQSPKYQKGHVHRLLVPILLFGGWVHFCISILTLLLFGFNNESFLGRPKYLLILVNGGVYGTLLSAIIYPYELPLFKQYLKIPRNHNQRVAHLHTAHAPIRYPHQKLPTTWTSRVTNSISLYFSKYIVTIFILVAGTNFLYMFDSKSADIGAILGGTLFGGSIAFYLFDKPSLNDRLIA
jgi:membrane associated rhomboid family serine protease